MQLINIISFDRIESVLAIIPTESVNVLLVDHCSRESALADVHGSKVFPLVALNVVDFAGVQEYVLHAVVATHDVNEVFIDHSCMLLPHLIHGAFLNKFFLLVGKLVDHG